MHVYYDYQIFALQNVGGISRYFVELAGRLPRCSSATQATVLAPIHINEHLAASAVHTLGKKFIEFPGKHHVLSRLNRLASCVWLEKLQPDIFHETYYSEHLQKVKAPRVLTVCDMIHERFPEQFFGPDRRVPHQKAAAVARADHIIAISHNTRSDLMRCLDVPKEKITVIPLASSLGATSPIVSPGHPRPYILYVGLRQGVKNFCTLLNAYSRSKLLQKDFDLICAGGGSFTPEELRHIHDAGLYDHVRHITVDDALLESLYTHATLFVYPSLYEGFGLPLLEAMRCGCPVISSSSSSMPEIGGDAALYFDPNDPEELRVIIESVASSDTHREDMREHGYTREKLFSWDVCAEKTANLYSDLV
jgi:glycosyltransferase involved in cell wall biosynthesis